MDRITLANGTAYNGYAGDMSALYLLQDFNGTFYLNQQEVTKSGALAAYREKGCRGDVDFSHAGKVYIDRIA